MKKLMIACTCLLWLTASAHAANHGVFLDTKRLRSESAAKTDEIKQWGSWEQDYKRHVVIEIELRNTLSQEDEIEVEWIFVAKTGKSNLKWIYDSGQQAVRLGPQERKYLYAKSRTLDEAVVEHIGQQRRLEEGSDRTGYIVIVRAEEKIINVTASSRNLEQLARSPAELLELRNALFSN